MSPAIAEPDVSLYDLGRDELAGLLDGEPRYRVDQVWQGLYAQHLEPGELSNVPKTLRSAIDELLPPALAPVRESIADRGDTIKQLWGLRDGHLIETVIMLYPNRSTVCVSSQAGCAMGCSFCATGQVGFDRHLTAGEIIEQVIRAARRIEALASAKSQGSAKTNHPINNIVFMGMGEPLANFDATWTAVERINGDMGIGARHITISTVGVVPGIRRMAEETLPVNLAVSLHAATDRKRDRIAPINKTFPLRELANALQHYLRSKSRRISFEWAMIDGVNDTPEDAIELSAYARPLRAHVNLIPLNATPGYRTQGTAPADVEAFRDRLEELGVNATVRHTRGSDIDAACGQLRAGQPVQLKHPRKRARA